MKELQELKALSACVSRIRRKGNVHCFPEALRAQALDLTARLGIELVSRETCLAPGMLYRWKKESIGASSNSCDTKIEVTRVSLVSPRESRAIAVLECSKGRLSIESMELALALAREMLGGSL